MIIWSERQVLLRPLREAIRAFSNIVLVLFHLAVRFNLIGEELRDRIMALWRHLMVWKVGFNLRLAIEMACYQGLVHLLPRWGDLLTWLALWDSATQLLICLCYFLVKHEISLFVQVLEALITIVVLCTLHLRGLLLIVIDSSPNLQIRRLLPRIIIRESHCLWPLIRFLMHRARAASLIRKNVMSHVFVEIWLLVGWSRAQPRLTSRLSLASLSRVLLYTGRTSNLAVIVHTWAASTIGLRHRSISVNVRVAWEALLLFGH